jgi:hypothetical protein
MTPNAFGAPRCEGRRRYDGKPCAAPRRTGSSFCYAHDPALGEERKAVQKRAAAAHEWARRAREMKREG